MHLQVVGFTVALFTEDHGEITNPVACNQVRASSRSRAAAISPCAYYLNIKNPISLAQHARRVFFVVGMIAAMLGTDMVVLLYFPGTPVGLLWFNSHYQCLTHVGLPFTVLVAHWPQQGTGHANPLWPQYASRTIAWHLRRSQEAT